MPYKVLEAMYKDVLEQLKAEKIMHPLINPAARV